MDMGTRSKNKYQCQEIGNSIKQLVTGNLKRYVLVNKQHIKKNKQSQSNYFPSSIQRLTIDKIHDSNQLSSRLIFLKGIIKPKQVPEIYQKIFSDQNPVYQRYQRLCQIGEDYAERYLKQKGRIIQEKVSYYLWRTQPKQKHYQYNLNFYKQSYNNELQNLKKQYDELEDRHDFIQWMFPNHFQSMFNSQSHPMSYLEVEQFRTNWDLGRKIFNSTLIFIDFIGLSLEVENQNLEFSLKVISFERLDNALIRNTHNHLRLRRVISCLSITGFRNIAVCLINFLRDLIYGKIKEAEKRYQKLQRVYQREWEIYGDSNKQKALSLCFHPEPQFPKTNQFLADNKGQIKKLINQFHQEGEIDKKDPNLEDEKKCQNEKKELSLSQPFQNSIQFKKDKYQSQGPIQNQKQIHQEEQSNKQMIQEISEPNIVEPGQKTQSQSFQHIQKRPNQSEKQ